MNEKKETRIEGIPDGWDLVRIGTPQVGEYIVGEFGRPFQAMGQFHDNGFAIIRKIEMPKQYRPFRSAKEFRPQRCRWVRHIASDSCSSVIAYNDRSVKFGSNKGYWDYEMAFETWVFDDGTPFGVEVA